MTQLEKSVFGAGFVKMTEDELYEVNGGRADNLFSRREDIGLGGREKSKYGDGHEMKRADPPSKEHYHPYRYAAARVAAEIVFAGHDAPAMKDAFARAISGHEPHKANFRERD